MKKEAESTMGFVAMKERRSQLASTIKAGTPFMAALLASKLIEFVRYFARKDVALQNAMLAEVAPLQHRGKGGGRPHQISHRFVAQDKRDAKKSRNRGRS